MSKSAPIKSLLRQHFNAIKVNHEAAETIAALRNGVMGTFITVPEFGSTHIFTGACLDAAVTQYEKRQGWAKDSSERAAFQERMASYHRALTDLVALKDQWRRDSGLEQLENLQWAAIYREHKAWREIITRLRARRDVKAIASYLGRKGASIPIRQLQEALRILGTGGRK